MPLSKVAHAKLNLALSVGPPLAGDHPRAGMHPIASWVHAIDLTDEITVERRQAGAGVTLDLAWAPGAPRQTPLDWSADTDLCVRAARVLAAETDSDIDVRIAVVKRIPVGAGLGGGSADAAATLQAINELLELDVSNVRLAGIACSIGSDVAFFLDDQTPPRPAIVSGLGDRIERLDRSRGQLVLCIPPFGCATRSVYRAFDELGPNPLRSEAVHSLARDTRPDARSLFNDLASAAGRVEPRLAELRRRIEDAAGLPAHLTGSGSAMFVLCADATEMAARIGEAAAGVACLPAQLV